LLAIQSAELNLIGNVRFLLDVVQALLALFLTHQRRSSEIMCLISQVIDCLRSASKGGARAESGYQGCRASGAMLEGCSHSPLEMPASTLHSHDYESLITISTRTLLQILQHGFIRSEHLAREDHIVGDFSLSLELH
jgi:hypothetical protein